MSIRKRNDGLTASRWGISMSELWERRRQGLKGCGICREWLPLDRFNKSAARGDGLQPNCAECTARAKRQARRG